MIKVSYRRFYQGKVVGVYCEANFYSYESALREIARWTQASEDRYEIWEVSAEILPPPAPETIIEFEPLEFVEAPKGENHGENSPR